MDHDHPEILNFDPLDTFTSLMGEIFIYDIINYWLQITGSGYTFEEIIEQELEDGMVPPKDLKAAFRSEVFLTMSFEDGLRSQFVPA
jgi:hypothetical protein